MLSNLLKLPPMAAELLFQFNKAVWFVATKFNFDHQFNEVGANDEDKYQVGAFKKIFKFNGKERKLIEFQELLKDQVCVVERWCESLWKFPSGVATALTWVFSGQAIRHEFVIVHTKKFIGTIELKIEYSEPIILLQFWEALTQQRKEQIHDVQIIGKQFGLDRRPWNRCLKRFNHHQIGQLPFQMINKMINVTIEFWRETGKKRPKLLQDYDIFQKNCKSLARTILYFSLESMEPEEVLKSMFGTFTDKPLEIHSIDLIAIEWAVWKAQRLSDNRADILDKGCVLIRRVRGQQQEEIELMSMT